MSRLFNPADLINQNLEANATRRDPLPIGETTAQILSFEIKNGISAKNQKAWARLDAKLEITDPEYLQNVPGTPEKTVTNLGVMLDLSDDGQIKTGPNVNVRLGRLREAAGVNGKPLSALPGQWIRIAIGHKQHPTEGDVVLDEVVSYTKV